MKVGLVLALSIILASGVQAAVAADPDSLRQRAEQGDAEAQATLGLRYFSAFGSDKDNAQARFWFEKAAEQGKADAQSILGDMYASGRGGPKDLDKAVVWYRKAAEQGNARARGNLRKLYLEGKIFPTLDDQAGAWWRKLAEQAKSEAETFSRFRAAAEAGDVDAETQLGLLYLNGIGTPKDRAKAGIWFGTAAEHGQIEAQCLFAAFTAANSAWRIASESARAVELCRKAANAGYADADLILAVHYDMGRGVPKDQAEAEVWWRKAAEQGNAEAQWHVGTSYERGRSVPKDEAQAIQWYVKAAEQGSESALRDLAMLALLAKEKDETLQLPGSLDPSSLSDLMVEHAYDDIRDLLPNLWASPLNRVEMKQALYGPLGIGGTILVLALFAGFLGSWAWGRRAVIGSLALGPILGLILAFAPMGKHLLISKAVQLVGDMSFAWWLGVIPGIAIGLAVRKIRHRHPA